jgi:hypothetical protein
MANSKRRHTDLFVVLLLVRSLAVAIYIFCAYLVFDFLNLFTSGEPGTELLIFAAPFLALYVVGGLALATALVTFSVLRRAPLRKSLNSQKRRTLALILPILLGAAIFSLYRFFPTDQKVINEHDAAKVELLYEISDKIHALQTTPQTLSVIDSDNKYESANIKYTHRFKDYQLCAVFEQSTLEMYGAESGDNLLGEARNSWTDNRYVNFDKHPKGQKCFTLNSQFSYR